MDQSAVANTAIGAISKRMQAYGLLQYYAKSIERAGGQRTRWMRSGTSEPVVDEFAKLIDLCAAWQVDPVEFLDIQVSEAKAQGGCFLTPYALCGPWAMERQRAYRKRMADAQIPVLQVDEGRMADEYVRQLMAFRCWLDHAAVTLNGSEPDHQLCPLPVEGIFAKRLSMALTIEPPPAYYRLLSAGWLVFCERHAVIMSTPQQPAPHAKVLDGFCRLFGEHDLRPEFRRAPG